MKKIHWRLLLVIVAAALWVALFVFGQGTPLAPAFGLSAVVVTFVFFLSLLSPRKSDPASEKSTPKSKFDLCKEMLFSAVQVEKKLTDALKDLSPDDLNKLEAIVKENIKSYHDEGGKTFYFPNSRNNAVLGHTRFLAIKAILANYIAFKEELDETWQQK